MRREKLLCWLLVIIFAALMSVPFLVPHCGFIALFGFVPLLCMNRIANLACLRHVWLYHYVGFVLWNAATTFWVCNATIGGGIFAVLANAFQMSVIFTLFRVSERRFKGILPYIFLVVMWIAWERAYFDADISWPWLVLGNAFARSTGSVQWYEFTGSLGGSLWIWLVNITLYRIMAAMSDGSTANWNGKGMTALVLWLVIVIAGPFILSKVLLDRYAEEENPMDVVVFQPNIDPYNKFQALTQAQQNDILIAQMTSALDGTWDDATTIPGTNASPKHRTRVSGTRNSQDLSESIDSLETSEYTDTLDIISVYDSLSTESPDTTIITEPAEKIKPILLIAPETFTSDIVVDQYSSSMTYRRLSAFLKDRPGVNILFGASSYSHFTSATRPSYSARQMNDGSWIESHNSALMIDGTGRVEICHKNKLVVGVEMIPYPKIFAKVDDWLGGVMGRCVGQDGVTVFNVASPTDTVKVGCAICYESVYGEYFTKYVREGAEAMAVITNDAWWGDTPGYRQHLSYARLRAIETRRDIARCGNTGISGFIDQRGVLHDPSPWWEQAVLKGRINLSDRQTFFVRHGDITGRVCTLLFALLLLALIVNMLIFRNREERKKRRPRYR
ncbi:MAG: apolipoprotein N-acyltransferase [Bacteroidales bacterium]|nr:apolipoprotein N-acyltransferase [Bacteroidales bacterium]